VDVSPTISINGGTTTAVQGQTVNIDSALGELKLNTLWDQVTIIGNGGGVNGVIIQGGKLIFNHEHSINPRGTPHIPKQTGVLQTMVIPLSGEQGPISQTSGAGVLPWVMMRAPFKMNIHGVRLHCAQTSSSGAVQVDIRLYPQNTVPTGANMNSTTGTTIFSTSQNRLQIDAGQYSSVGSTAVATNGTVNGTPTVQDDGLIGIYIIQPGTNVLGLKATLYYSYTE
jgi:hypothetical protein